MTAPDAFLRRLQAHGALSEEEVASFQALAGPPRPVGACCDLIAEGEPFPSCFILDDGWALRYLNGAEDSRQVLDVLVPGTFLGLRALARPLADHTVTTLTAAAVRPVDPDGLRAVLDRYEGLRGAFLRAVIDGQQTLREPANSVRHSLAAQIARFLVRIRQRLRDVALAEGGWPVKVPIDKALLAEAFRMDGDAVSEALHALSVAGWIETAAGGIVVRDVVALASFGAETMPARPRPLKSHARVVPMQVPRARDELEAARPLGAGFWQQRRSRHANRSAKASADSTESLSAMGARPAFARE